MKCKTCIYGNCVGTVVKTGEGIYDCSHEQELVYIGYSKGNWLWLFNHG